jgi:hypothetical protein
MAPLTDVKRDYSNTMLSGIIAGLLAPPLSFLAYKFLFRPDETIHEVLNGFIRLDVLTHVISLSVVPNLLVFFLFLWAGKERSAHGVIGATIIYALMVAGIIFI